MYLTRLSALFNVLTGGAVVANQAPFQLRPQTLTSNHNQWNLNLLPNSSSTHNLIFDTANSLLQHWPNTRYRNGHTIVPGIIPLGTLLYHGRGYSSIPEEPDWVSTDPEHSILFCTWIIASQKSGNFTFKPPYHHKPGKECWQHTFSTTRPLKVLYFDGSSAAKMPDGPMDSQDVAVWGRVYPDRWEDEWNRITEMCEWGKKFQVDGFVRMEMNFEVMLCNFTEGVEVVSSSQLALMDQKRDLPGPRLNNGSPPLDPHHPVVFAGGWHNQFPGDTRILLDYSRIISFYDTNLVPSLIHARRNTNARLDHRILGADDKELWLVQSRLTSVLYGLPTIIPSSGIDWKTTLHVVTDRYADRLEGLQQLLNITEHSPSEDVLLKRLKKVQSLLNVILQPYILLSALNESQTTTGEDNRWAEPVYQLCSTTHTRAMRTSSVISSKFTQSEWTLLDAIDGTTKEICRVVTLLWSTGIKLHQNGTDIRAVARDFKSKVDSLIEWLDWSSLWLRCKPACSFEEVCYLPTWPYFGGGRDNGSKDPQPRCIRKTEFLYNDVDVIGQS